MMTIVQLRELMGRQIGLPATFDGSIDAYRNLSAESQIALTRACVAYVRQNPDKFNAAQVDTATVEASRADRLTYEDPGFSAEEFFDELAIEAKKTIGEPLAAIGTGVSQSVQLVGTLLPVLALIAVAVFVWPYIAKAKNAA
jgi:hypothetical protein